MKKFFDSLMLVVIAALSLFTISSCGGDDEEEQGNTLKENITTRNCSITAGAEVDASDVDVITIEYNTAVTISSDANITLNGQKVTAKTNSVTALKVDIPVTLEAGTSYTLVIPSGSVFGKSDATRTAAYYSISFTTKALPVVGAIDNLCDASATTETVKLYDYLKQCYGSKTLSSVIADVNWNHKEADKIYKTTGKYPAFNCYDFIHIYVPSGNGWINYSDITPVTEWVNAGGLVQLMWHFNVPLTETTEVKSDGSGVTCTPSETTFKASNALKDGTWENKWFYGQMDKVIEVLLKLQDKKIAAVWRPFHEAAGNAMLKSGASWGKSWFWWGYEGSDTFKSLWKAMFDYFQKKGVHILIWVWTTQNYNGDSSLYNNDADWYPGDNYVDIVGRDLYGYNATQNSTEFTEITTRYPKKMVTLAECGVSESSAFTEVSDFWAKGAKWLSFMPWYGSSMPSDDWWKNAMSNENVITRDGVKIQ